MFTNRQSSKRFLVTGLVALYTAVPTWIGLQADDTEIYVNKVPEAQVPNVLFTIDTSGSMGNDVPGGGQTRMEAVKDALTGLINDTDNLKAGLERFHNELGAPIIFPVTSLSDTPGFLDDSVDVSSIDRATDDAEEAGGVVDLGGSSLEMTIYEEGGDLEIFEIEAQPLQSSDDDEEGTGGGLDLNSPDLDDADSGIRFRNVAIPSGATILHAEIELVNNSNSSAKSDKIIHGHDVDDSPTFTETGPDSVAARFTDAPTDASVPWSNISEDIDAGDAATSPNIHAIVQEIVNRAGWASGNDLTILLENTTDNHEFSSFDQDNPPVLRVSYIVGGTTVERDIDATARDANEDGDGNVNTTLNGFYLLRDQRFSGATDDLTHGGLIFPNLDIPDSAEVVWADIEFLSAFDFEQDLTPADLNTADMEILGIADPQLNGFSAGNPITGQPTTTAQVDWIAGLSQGDEEIFTPDEDEPLYTPNLAAIVEELRAAPGFDRGDNNKNNIGFVFRDPDGTGFNTRTTCSFDGDAAYGCPETVEQPPTLRLVYGTPSAVTTVNQQVGLRFNNVLVPQGAVIESARLEFTVAGETTTTGTLNIEVEDNTAPVTYSNNAGERVSDRTYAGGSVSWTTDAWDTIGDIKQSPDIKNLVEQVTNQSGWCGGGSLAFRITSSDARNIAEAWEAGGSGAPKLRIDYDTSGLSAGEGCTTRQLTVAIDDEDDDVEENNNNGNILFNNADLDIEDGWLVGLRFTDVDIPLGANILSTNLLLDADDPNPDSGNHTINIRAEQHPNAPPFTNAQYDVSSRDYGSSSIDWVETTTWNEGTTYSPGDDGFDLTPLIQDIIDGTVTDGGEQWAAGNALVFALQGIGGERDAEVCCGQADSPARLEIFFEVLLGNLGGASSVTARQVLLNTIDDLVADGYTPPVDALTEGAYYFGSEPVHFGRTRGGGMSYEGSGVTTDTDLDSQIDGETDTELLEKGEKSRLSHFATYTPQSADIEREGDCSAENPNHADCANEHIDNDNQNVTYVSPFETAETCEKGFLVLLSDGIANRNSSRDLIKGLTGVPSCDMDIPVIDGFGDPVINGDGSLAQRAASSDELCGLELVDWMHDTDFIDEPGNPVDVRNNVRTFTIGFDLQGNKAALEFLKALAFVGNGGDLDDADGVEGVSYGDGFYTADNAEQLKDVFEIIVSEIIDETTSFVAPGISVNAFNRLFNLDDIYFSLFRPDDNVAWLGNLKKFKLCDGQPDCEFGETIDRGGQPAVNLDETDLDTFGTLKVGAVGFWSDPNDDSAPEIDQGGAGEKIPTHTARNVYVNTSDGTVPAPDFTDPVKDQGTALHKIDLTSDTDGTPATADDYNDLKTALLDANNCDSGSATLDEQNDCLNELIEWITGKLFEGDIPRDGSDDDVDRWAFGDPMHSRPLVLTYGRDVRDASDPDDDVPLSKIIVGTNDGGVRMINEGDAVEEWIFHPNSMLGMQSVLKDNPKGAHEYGIDDTPTARIKDTDDDNVIDPALGDFVHLYFGLRRGGRQVFALNITPESTVGLDSTVTWNAGTDNEFVVSIGEKGKVVPEILWRIDGTDPLFQRLGMSWSTPRPVRIAGNSGPRTVLIFGGGYDAATQDGEDTDGTPPDGGDNYTGPSGSALGNAIFIVDADTGERLWWASSSQDGNGDAADADVPDMNTSIPAPVTTLDTNGDGLVDRLYAVDMRGQVFRVDIEANPSPGAGESEFSNSSVGTLARLGSETANEDRRKFFYAPEVARVNDESLVTEPYELVGLISGNRAQPQGKTVLDRAYAIRDFRTENPSGGLSSSNFPKCNPQATTCPTAGEPLTHSELTNVTEKSSFVIRNDDGSVDADSDAAIDNLVASHGWYFDLEGNEFDDGDPLVTPLTGEKGFSAATVLDGKMFFTTFLPPEDTSDTSDACTAPELLGTSRFYAVDFFTGAPVFDTNDDSDFDKGERFQSLGAGPSADVIPAYLPGGVTLPVPTGAGAIAKDPEISQKVNKTFWLEEQ